MDNTANFNTLMSTESSVDTLHILLKKAKELAANDLEYLRLQKKATDDKIAQIKGQSEEEIKANNRAELLRKAQERRQKEWEDREISDYQESLKRDEVVRKRQEKLQELEDERMERETKAAEEAKKSYLLTAVPDKIKNAKPQEEQVDDKKKDGLFSRLNEGYKQFTDTFKNAKKQQEDGEQKNLGEKINRVSFNPEGIKVLFTLISPLYKGFEAFNVLKKLEGIGEEIVINTKPKNGLLDMLGKLLLMGGIAATLVGLFWPKIKDFLEKKLGVNLDFLEKFRGIVEGIGKFFTMGGLKITLGGPLKIVGGVIKSFGELIETGLTAAFKAIFSGGGAAAGEAVGGAAKVGTGFKGLLPRIAGGLFKGLGATVLKGIPIIGGLISLGFAFSRFKSGDYVGGVIDLVGGIANFLELIPGLGLIPMAISLGAAALNTFLDFKAGGEKNSQSKKLGAIGGLFLGFWNMLKKIPVIGTVLTFAEGTGQFFTSLVTGNMSGMKTGLEKMGQMPIVGLAVSPLLALLDSVKTDSQGKVNGFDASSIWKNLKMRVGKTILSWFDWLPKSWQKGIADLMGVPFEGGNEKEGDEGAGTSQAEKKLASDKAKLADFNLAHGEKGGDAKERAELENAVKQGQGQVDGAKSSDQLNDEKYKTLQNDYESKKSDLEKYEKEWGDNAPVQHKQKQLELENAKNALDQYNQNKKSSVTVAPQNAPDRKNYEPAPVEPQVSTTPENGITKMNSALNDNLMKTFSMLSDRLATSVGDTKQGPTIINNTTQSAPSHDNTKEYLFKPVRDVNYDKRMSWWGNSMNYRATLP